MNRLLSSAFVFVAVAVGTMQAGTITEIGAVTGGQNYGLTSAYITGSLNSQTSTHFVETNYATTLFQNATESSVAVAAPMATTSSPVTVSDPTTGATFAMIGDNSLGTLNGWDNNSTSNASSFYVPVNIFNVDTVWTMLNDTLGTKLGTETSVTFYFNTTDTMSGATAETVTLVDGTEIRSSVLCTFGGPGTCPSTQPTSLSVGPTAASATGTLSSVNVTTGQVTGFTEPYNLIPTSGTGCNGAACADAGSSGSITLDDQKFSFGSTFNGMYLVDIKVADTASGISADHVVLSAVSVDATPEPSTIILFMAGFVMLGFVQHRRRNHSLASQQL
jgi:hypothetical protein